MTYEEVEKKDPTEFAARNANKLTYRSALRCVCRCFGASDGVLMVVWFGLVLMWLLLAQLSGRRELQRRDRPSGDHYLRARAHVQTHPRHRTPGRSAMP